MATDSPGITTYMNTGGHPDLPFVWATDATHTRYEGAGSVSGSASKEYVLRAGSSVEVHFDAARSTTSIEACKAVSTIEVHCSGTTTLGK